MEAIGLSRDRVLNANPNLSLAARCQAVGNSQTPLPPFNFEIRTLSNRADLIRDRDALIRADFVADGDARMLRGGAERPRRRSEYLRRRFQRKWPGPAMGEPYDHRSRQQPDRFATTPSTRIREEQLMRPPSRVFDYVIGLERDNKD
jgi:hypothetical protein